MQSFQDSFCILHVPTPGAHTQGYHCSPGLAPDTQALHLLVLGRPASGTYGWVGFLLKGSTPVPAELSQCVK